MTLSILTGIFLSLGVFFFFGTTVGLIRFPDFYSRMHAAGKGDTLSSLFLLIGLALYNFHDLSFATMLTVLKLFFICIFIFLASPTATHAIMDAGYEAKVKPWIKRNHENDKDYKGPERRKKERHT